MHVQKYGHGDEIGFRANARRIHDRCHSCQDWADWSVDLPVRVDPGDEEGGGDGEGRVGDGGTAASTGPKADGGGLRGAGARGVLAVPRTQSPSSSLPDEDGGATRTGGRGRTTAPPPLRRRRTRRKRGRGTGAPPG
ncbi:hypothetical protein THAOC_00868, partial [Thalassiosira oceanica]